jgi:hypothetical protein
MKTLTRSLLFRSTLLLIGCVAIGGCGLTQSKQDAEKVLARHFQAVATNGYDSAMGDYGAQFFQKTTKDEWSKTLARLSGKLGAFQGYSVGGWQVFKNAGTFGAGTTVSLKCQVTYAKYPATESFTLFKGTSDSDYKIVGHSINSDGFLKE